MAPQRTKNYPGKLIVTALSLSPLLIWANMAPLAGRFGSPAMTLASIGQALGLVGMAMFALTLTLSTRHPVLERFFSGMNQAYTAHHTFGGVAFSLLLFHPLMLALNRATLASPHEATRFLLSTDPNTLFGLAALLSMILLLVLTFFVSFAYDKWKMTHKFLAASFMLASIHLLLVPSDTQASPALYWYMNMFVALGGASILYRTALSRLFVPYAQYTIDEVRRLGEHVTEIFMTPVDRPIAHRPGQFMFVSFANKTVGKESHPFSIVSAPGEPRLAIAAKAIGDHTSKFSLLTKGTMVRIEGPFGVFSHDRAPGKEQIWIAGGIGITPFIGMAKSVAADPNYRISLYYCVNDPTEAVFLEELRVATQQNPNFKTIPFYSKERGRLTADALQETGEDIVSKEFFICGPPPMMQSLREQLLEKGVARSRIHTEEFTLR